MRARISLKLLTALRALSTTFPTCPRDFDAASSTFRRGFIARPSDHRFSANANSLRQKSPWNSTFGYRGMFIQTQSTPNPSSLMFLPGRTVLEKGSMDFSSGRSASSSPLAKSLFRIDGVSGVFLGSDFITVSITGDADWSTTKPEVFAAIMDFFSSGQPVVTDTDDTNVTVDEDDDEVVAMIKELLETRIRPSVQEDGGDIDFRGYDADSGVVTLKMQGACKGCPSSAVTLKSGIQNMLMHYVPEVTAVVEAEDEDEMELES